MPGKADCRTESLKGSSHEAGPGCSAASCCQDSRGGVGRGGAGQSARNKLPGQTGGQMYRKQNKIEVQTLLEILMKGLKLAKDYLKKKKKNNIIVDCCDSFLDGSLIDGICLYNCSVLFEFCEHPF